MYLADSTLQWDGLQLEGAVAPLQEAVQTQQWIYNTQQNLIMVPAWDVRQGLMLSNAMLQTQTMWQQSWCYSEQGDSVVEPDISGRSAQGASEEDGQGRCRSSANTLVQGGASRIGLEYRSSRTKEKGRPKIWKAKAASKVPKTHELKITFKDTTEREDSKKWLMEELKNYLQAEGIKEDDVDEKSMKFRVVTADGRKWDEQQIEELEKRHPDGLPESSFPMTAIFTFSESEASLGITHGGWYAGSDQEPPKYRILQRPQSSSNPANEATKEAFKKEDAPEDQFPQLCGETSRVTCKLPAASVWRDPAIIASSAPRPHCPTPPPPPLEDEEEDSDIPEPAPEPAQRCRSVPDSLKWAANSIAALPKPSLPRWGRASSGFTSKVSSTVQASAKPMRDAEVQCELLNVEVQCDLLPTMPMPHICESCVNAEDAKSGMAEVKAAEWGPASDWTTEWDLDETTDDTNCMWTVEEAAVQKPSSRNLPPTPAGPAPVLPLGKDTSKGNTAMRPCPAMPCGSSTTTAVHSDASASEKPASLCSGTPRTPGSEADCGAPTLSSDIKPNPAEVNALMDKLVQLRKKCREIERLEERFEKGYTLNAEEKAKAARLGTSSFLRRRMERTEARIAKMVEGGAVSSTDTSDEEVCQVHPMVLTPQVNSTVRQDTTAAVRAAPKCEPAAKALAKASGESCVDRKKVVQKTVVQRKPQAETKAPVQAAPVVTQAVKGKKNWKTSGGKRTSNHWALGIRRKLIRHANRIYAIVWEPHNRAVVLAAFVLMCGLVVVVLAKYQAAGIPTVMQENSVDGADALDAATLSPGASHAWVVNAPRYAEVGDHRIKSRVRAIDVEIARAAAAIRQVESDIAFRGYQARTSARRAQKKKHPESGAMRPWWETGDYRRTQLQNLLHSIQRNRVQRNRVQPTTRRISHKARLGNVFQQSQKQLHRVQKKQKAKLPPKQAPKLQRHKVEQQRLAGMVAKGKRKVR
jgi:hypothetical protein